MYSHFVEGDFLDSVLGAQFNCGSDQGRSGEGAEVDGGGCGDNGGEA